MSIDKRKLRQYEIVVYIALFLFAVILGFIGHHTTAETLKSILLNLTSEFLAVALLFFIINRFFLLGDSGHKPEEQKITVILNHGAKKLELPVEMRRSEFSRAEILGRIGMIPTTEKGKRFSLKYTNTREFLQQINQILSTGQKRVRNEPF